MMNPTRPQKVFRSVVKSIFHSGTLWRKMPPNITMSPRRKAITLDRPGRNSINTAPTQSRAPLSRHNDASRYMIIISFFTVFVHEAFFASHA